MDQFDDKNQSKQTKVSNASKKYQSKDVSLDLEEKVAIFFQFSKTDTGKMGK